MSTITDLGRALDRVLDPKLMPVGCSVTMEIARGGIAYTVDLRDRRVRGGRTWDKLSEEPEGILNAVRHAVETLEDKS